MARNLALLALNTELISFGNVYIKSPSDDTAISPRVSEASVVKSFRACDKDIPADVAKSDATTGPFDFSIALITCLEGNFSINSSYNGTIPLFVELYKGFTAEFLGVDGSSEKHPPLGVNMGVDGGLIENALHDDDRHDIMNTANTVVAAYIFIAMVPLF